MSYFAVNKIIHDELFVYTGFPSIIISLVEDYLKTEIRVDFVDTTDSVSRITSIFSASFPRTINNKTTHLSSQTSLSNSQYSHGSSCAPTSLRVQLTGASTLGIQGSNIDSSSTSFSTSPTSLSTVSSQYSIADGSAIELPEFVSERFDFSVNPQHCPKELCDHFNQLLKEYLKTCESVWGRGERCGQPWVDAAYERLSIFAKRHPALELALPTKLKVPYYSGGKYHL